MKAFAGFAAFVLAAVVVSVPFCMAIARVAMQPSMKSRSAAGYPCCEPVRRVQAAEGTNGSYPLGPGDYPASLRRFIHGASHLCAVPPRIVGSLAFRESSFNPLARSSAGAVGLTQLMPDTARFMGLTVNRHRDDRTDPWRSLVGGACYLRLLRDQFGSWRLALAAYHGGPGNMTRGTTPQVSWAYAADVMAGAE